MYVSAFMPQLGELALSCVSIAPSSASLASCVLPCALYASSACPSCQFWQLTKFCRSPSICTRPFGLFELEMIIITNPAKSAMLQLVHHDNSKEVDKPSGTLPALFGWTLAEHDIFPRLQTALGKCKGQNGMRAILVTVEPS